MAPYQLSLTAAIKRWPKPQPRTCFWKRTSGVQDGLQVNPEPPKWKKTHQCYLGGHRGLTDSLIQLVCIKDDNTTFSNAGNWTSIEGASIFCWNLSAPSPRWLIPCCCTFLVYFSSISGVLSLSVSVCLLVVLSSLKFPQYFPEC